MSTLVAYDSSSDEDEPVATTSAGSIQNNNIVTQTGEQVRPVTANTFQDAPMYGPSIPTEISQQYPDFEEEGSLGLSLSERDIVRHLTQASHPMTEMPPSPPGSPDPSAGKRIKHFLHLKAKGIHFNEDLASKSAFKNPMLFHALIDRAGLDNGLAYRTSLPTTILPTAKLPSAGYKEALLKSQQTIRAQQEVEKKALATAGKRTVEFTSGGMSGTSSARSSPGDLQKRHKH